MAIGYPACLSARRVATMWRMIAQFTFLIASASGVVPRVINAQSRLSVDSLPLVDIRGTSPNGEVVFERPAGATRLSSGQIVIADATAGMLRFFTRTGELQRVVGRSGSGPGEFRIISWLGQCGVDSIFAWDLMQLRMTIVDAAGQVIRQHRVPSDAGAGSPPSLLSCSREGVFGLLSQPRDLGSVLGGAQFARYKSELLIADFRGAITHSIGDVMAGEIANTSGGVSPRPLGRFTSIAVSRDRIYVGTADSASIDVYTLAGKRLASLPLHVTARRPTKRNFESSIDALVGFATGAMREHVKQRLLEVPMPDDLPPYSALFVDPDGTLWVQLSAPGDPVTLLRALGPSGAAVNDVQLPVGLTVYEIGRDYILGAYEARDGQPHVAAYRVRAVR